ncbi:MAG: Crp/Fnr family transcriptional regulator [Rhodospirillales bacterium]
MLERALKSLSPDDITALETMGQKRTIPNGEAVVEEGMEVDTVFMILRGEGRLVRYYLDDMAAEFTGPLGPGDLIGEMSFVDPAGASARVVADGELEVFVLTRRSIEDHMVVDPTFAGRFYHSILLTLCRKLRRTNRRVMPHGD